MHLACRHVPLHAAHYSTSAPARQLTTRRCKHPGACPQIPDPGPPAASAPSAGKMTAATHHLAVGKPRQPVLVALPNQVAPLVLIQAVTLKFITEQQRPGQAAVAAGLLRLRQAAAAARRLRRLLLLGLLLGLLPLCYGQLWPWARGWRWRGSRGRAASCWWRLGPRRCRWRRGVCLLQLPRCRALHSGRQGVCARRIRLCNHRPTSSNACITLSTHSAPLGRRLGRQHRLRAAAGRAAVLRPCRRRHRWVAAAATAAAWCGEPALACRWF